MTDLSTDPQSPEYDQLSARIGLAWRDLRRGASTSVLREYLLGKGEESIEMGQMDTLDLLSSGQPWRMSELAEALRVEPSTATRAVHRLVNAGLAVRSSSEDDGRVVRVEITAEGRAVHDEVAARRRTLLGYVMDRFRRDEIVEFVEMLERYVALVDEFVDQQSAK